jgi:type IV secretion system protein VirD4
LTAGEVMQLPPSDELVLVSGTPPMRARKARYFEDRRLTDRVRPPPSGEAIQVRSLKQGDGDDWMALPTPASAPREDRSQCADDDGANSGIRREPTLPEHEAIAPEGWEVSAPVANVDDQSNEASVRSAAIRHRLRSVARQAAMDPDDGMAL